jgi:tetratricopeptide (TPR) repeat protein
LEVTLRNKTILVAIGLVSGTIAAYSSLGENAFVNFDDPDYLTANPHVQEGLTWHSIQWAFTTGHASNWHPITWLSHQMDWTLFGDNAALHHAESCAWHVASGLVLLWVLVCMTGQLWPSAVVAAIFLSHPLQVESVAWAAQRKSVLSLFFAMLTLLAYERYTKDRRPLRYIAVLVAFSLALLAKPAVVTLPFVLLLLDIWPLQRLRLTGTRESSTALRLLLEKLPLLALAIAVSLVTYYVQETAKTDADSLPLAQRLGNAVVSYVQYLKLFVWPEHLAVLYPHPRATLAPWKIAGSTCILIAISFLAYRLRKTKPYLLVGWLWYLGTLVPMIGLVQVGRQSHADRYAYLPILGLALMLAYGLYEVTARRPLAGKLVTVAIGAWLCWLSFRTHAQVSKWKDSSTLFEHTIAVTERNSLAHYMLGLDRGSRGEVSAAIAEMQKALAVEPGEHHAHLAIASYLVQKREYEDALIELNLALEKKPDAADAYARRGELHLLLGDPSKALADFIAASKLDPQSMNVRVHAAEAMLRLGKNAEAETAFQSILKRQGNAGAHNGLGVLAAQRGENATAEKHFRDALDIDPVALDPRRNLAVLFVKTGRIPKAEKLLSEGFKRHPEPEARHEFLGVLLAERQYRSAANVLRGTLEREPDNVEAMNNLAWILATSPGLNTTERQEGLTWAQKAVQASHGDIGYRDTHAAALAAAGDFPAAIKTAALVIEHADRYGNTALAEQARQRLALYRQGKPYVVDETVSAGHQREAP